VEGARRADAQDIPTLAALCREGLAEVADARGGAVYRLREARSEPVEASLAEDLRAADRIVLAGTYDGVVVGYAVVCAEVLHDGSRLAVMTDLYVEPEAREVGVGDALVIETLAWAAEQGCIGADAVALPGDRHTKNFFEAHGFTARLLVVHRVVGEAG
jgi:GNAT superfamily N-acetyltransferase